MNRSILLEIQETVMKYADIMSKISGIDVEVVDENLFRVAGTGLFADKVNEDMSQEAYVYRHILETGRPQIIYQPGEAAFCQSCPKKENCGEEIEISMPVRLERKIIGVIGLVGSTLKQKNMILKNEKMYLELVEQITDFITAKAAEILEMEKMEALMATLECTMNRVEQGILILSNKGSVTAANDSARKQLKLEVSEKSQIQIEPTGDSMNGQTEYRIAARGCTHQVLGQLYDLEQAGGLYSQVFVFTDNKDYHNKLYEMTATLNVGSIIGSSKRTGELRQEISKIAGSTSTVLITGESGTGKELVATAIWKASQRKDKRFIAINCAAIPEPLLESELFGYVKGAFTGADPNGRIGKFELANHGVIFLDEIGDMPLYLQAKLLRVLQERKITRIGSNQVIPIDIRVIAATNRDLKTMIKDNKFREDLYYRLNVIPLQIAPLRERKEDIIDLTEFFSRRYSRLFGKTLKGIDSQALEALQNHRWTGNVRELENTIEFMVNMIGEDGILTVKTLPRGFLKDDQTEDLNEARENKAFLNVEEHEDGLIIPMKELEKQAIWAALNKFGRDTEGKKKAAKALGIGLATLYRKLENF
ncbi:sigma-54 interaction domain-containing protein [Lachnoclostridium edouardi]|uniref:sigma-54 interaction domain-containing protein n=1 Tax=Lachnoclostridium edouardi TaxID=1926283 RepID=UPI002E8E0F10|nr:sigma 54-interacting transcriptional regulator [Lachnoclostridium edouardi]